jgi:DNA-binding NtrC family response regulator
MIAHRVEGRTLRVLAVDDEPALGKVVSRLLAVDGHTVVVARSVDEAIEELAQDRFDVVLSDLGLGPGAEAGGWDLARHVAMHYPGTRFLLATGWGPQIDPKVAVARGVHAIVSKPYKLNELRNIVANAS